MFSTLEGFRVWFTYMVGGGARKYRVHRKKTGMWAVQSKGGGMGPFWGPACLSDFTTEAEARFWKARWQKQYEEEVCNKSK